MKTTLAVLAGVAALAVAGCGSSSSSSSSSSSAATSATPPPTTSSGGGGGSSVKLSADAGGALKFDKSSATAKAGKVTLTMNNPASLQHGIAVKGNGVTQAGSIVGQGGTSTVTVSLKPGTYEFYCPVPGHEQAGMKGTLTVK